MGQDYEQIWGQYFNVSTPKPITKTNPNISDVSKLFIYQSIFKDLSNYAIYFYKKNDYYILSEQNKFFNGNGTIYIRGESYFVSNHFYSFNISGSTFIACSAVNSTVTEGSISSYNNSYIGSLFQYGGLLNINAVNFSKCQTSQASAVYCQLVKNLVNVSCCCIDSCHATSYATVSFNDLSAELMRSII